MLLLATLSAPLATSSDVGWRDSSGQVVPDSQDQRVVNGFGAWVIVTPDKD